MDSSNQSRILRFGHFEVDLRSGELRRNGFTVKLQGQPFQILAMLLERPGQLLTREEIRGRLWPADTFVDFDHSLNSAITRLREALGDSADNPRYVETLPRRGYRFIGLVEKPGIDVPSPSGGTASRQRKATWVGVTGVSVVVLLSAIALWTTWIRPGRTSSPSLELVPLVALQRAQASPAFSPDGNQVAFGGYEGEDSAIYTALVGGDKPLRLTVKSGVCCPSWSPD